eukprot:TRINITY_DN3589_c0_g1_i2.p1 TRINITY_DN3589_c0_g1~~TRINITY_DN3589_c0_g1_i2.p1  ORF type:complete len:1747 (+),score=210.18 TRINITY_DN3589_c0_g1_i2:116-5356(+)
MEETLKRVTPSLPWESYFEPERQHEFSSPPDLFVKSLNRRFLAFVEERLEAYQRETIAAPSSLRYHVFEYLHPEQDPRLGELFASYGIVGKHGLTSMVQGLLEWRASARLRKADLTSSSVTNVKTLKPFLDEVIAVSVDYLFCKLVLSVLGTHHKEHNPLDPEVAKELEKACFHYFDSNRGVVQTTKKDGSELAESKRHVFELFGEMLGELSIHRFMPITEKLFAALEDAKTAKDQSSAIAIIYAMRSLRLDITGSKRLKMSLEFVEQLRDNYFDPKHKKQMKLVQLALFEMLASILTPVIDMAPYASKEDLYTDWLDGCVDLHKKVDLYSKKVKNKESSLYPLQTVILCAGPTDYLDAQLPPLMEKLIKCAKPGEKLKSVALECLYRILLASMVRKEKQEHVDFCRKISGRLFPMDPKRSKEHVIGSPEDCVDVIVDIVHLMSIHDLSFVSKEVILPLLRDRPSAFPDRTVVAFLAFNAIVDRLGVYTQGVASSDATIRRHHRRESTQSGFMGKDFRRDTLRKRGPRLIAHQKDEEDDGSEVEDFVREVSKALDPALADLDSLFGSFLLIDPKYAQKDILELIGSGKGGQRVAYHTVLAALKRTHPTKMSALDLAATLSRYTLHVDPVVREHGFSALQHMMKHQPSLRLTVVEEFAKFIASIPYVFDEHIRSSLMRLSQLLLLWHSLITNAGRQSHRVKQDGLAVSSKFSEAEIEGTAIVYLCSGLPAVREAALTVLQSVASLNDALKQWHTPAATVPKLLIQSIKDHAPALVAASRVDPTRIASITTTGQEANAPSSRIGSRNLPIAGSSSSAGANTTAFANIEELLKLPTAEAQIAWTRILGRLVQLALPDAPDSISVSLRHIVARLPSVQFALERSTKGQGLSPDADVLLLSWRNYATVACASCAACGGSTDQEPTSSHHLFSSILPFLKISPLLADALTLALSFVHSSAYAVLFDALETYDLEVYASLKTKGRPKDAILRLRYHLALITRVASTTLADGHPFDESTALLQHFFEWIRQTKAFLETVLMEYNVGIQGLRYDFFVVVWSVLNELHTAGSEKLDELFPPIVRATLFEFAMRYCGHVPAYFNQLNPGDAHKGNELEESEKLVYEKRKRYVEHSALRAMGATLFGGGFYEVEVEQERNGPLFGWFTECFLSGKEEVRQIAKYAITNYIDANPEHDDELFNICTDLCYSKESTVGRGYFEAAAHIVMDRDINYSLPAIMNVCLLKLANPLAAVRSVAMAVLSHVANSLKYEIAPIPAVSHTSNALQYKISSLLAADYPQLAGDLFSSVWHRITTTEDRSAHVQMLYYLPPWMHHIDLSDIPNEKATEFLQNLSVLSTRYGTEHAAVIENVWAALIRMHGAANLPIVLDFLIHTSVQTRNEAFLPTARQIAVCVARVKGQEGVEYLAQQAYDTIPVKLDHDPQGEEADADRPIATEPTEESASQDAPTVEDEASKESWEFGRVFPVNLRTFHPLSRSDICLILLIEVSIEHVQEVQKYLARIIHASFIGLDSHNPIVYKHSRELVTNIVHSLASANGGIGSQPAALQLIRQLAQLSPGPVWKNEDTSITNLDPASATQLSEWVHSLVRALPFCSTIVDDWGTEALTWAAKIGRVPAHYVYRSFQIYRALVPLGCKLTEDAVISILGIWYKHESKRPLDKIGLAIDIMQVWLVLIKHKSGAELMKYPSIFWATTSVLYTDYPEEFLYTIRVLTAWLQRVEPDKKDVAAALTSSASNDAY